MFAPKRFHLTCPLLWRTAGTENSDQARDFDLPLSERFYLQPQTPALAAARVKTSVQDIINLKPLIDKKAWPYVQNDLRLRASYLRYDLKTVIASKPKEEKKPKEVSFLPIIIIKSGGAATLVLVTVCLLVLGLQLKDFLCLFPGDGDAQDPAALRWLHRPHQAPHLQDQR